MKRRDFFTHSLLGSGLTLASLLALPSCASLTNGSDTNRSPSAENVSKKNYRIRFEANQPCH